ncbi:MAG: helix-turn-helix domain-containing protein [Nitrospiria bacterium]
MSWEASGWAKKIRVCPSGELITRSEKFLLLTLGDYHNHHTQTAFVSVTTLAYDTLCSERQCRYLLRSLETKGLIATVIGHSGKTNSYTFPDLFGSYPQVGQSYPQVGQPLPHPGATTAPHGATTAPPDGATTAPYGAIAIAGDGAIAIAPKPDLTIKKKEEEQERRPEWIPEQLWEDFKDTRKRIRKPMTAFAERLAFKKLEKLRLSGEDPVAVIEQSIMNSYVGLWPVNDGRKSKLTGSEETAHKIQEALTRGL